MLLSFLNCEQIPSGPTGWTSISYKRNFKDPVFAVLYIFALAAYFILGIVLLFTTSVRTICSSNCFPYFSRLPKAREKIVLAMLN
jgi:hypothetical protein